MSARGRIVVVGSINLDIVAYAERLPRPGETLHGMRYTLGLGGKGANQAAAAARLGNEVSIIGRIGADAFGDEVLSALGGFGIDLSAIRRDDSNATGIAIIGVDAKGENAITVIGGANMAMTAGDLDAAEAALRGAAIVMTQREVPEAVTLAAADRARAAGALVMHDPAPAPARGLSDEAIRRFDILTPNESETEALTGIRPNSPESAARAARMLTERGASTVVVKMGALGAYGAGPAGTAFVPPFPVDAVDSVGAGDCFNAGLADALARGAALPTALRFAAGCGALAVTRYGAAAAAPGRAEVEQLLARA